MELLEDPHYLEAYIRLAKKITKPKSIPRKLGAYAAKLRTEAATGSEHEVKRGPGAPKKDHVKGWRKLSLAIEKHPGLSKVEAMRRILGGMFPSASDDEIIKKARECAQHLRDAAKPRKSQE